MVSCSGIGRIRQAVLYAFDSLQLTGMLTELELFIWTALVALPEFESLIRTGSYASVSQDLV